MKLWRWLILIVLVASLGMAVSCSGEKSEAQAKDQEGSEQRVATEESYTLPTMIELGSETCIPCQKMVPVMEALREEHADKIEIRFYDVKKLPDMAKKFQIRLIPTQVFLKADGTEFFRHEGFFPKEEIEKVFQDMGVTF